MKGTLFLQALAGISLAAPLEQDWAQLANKIRNAFGQPGIEFNHDFSLPSGGHISPQRTVYETLFSPVNTSQQTKDALDGRSIAPLFWFPFGSSSVIIQPIFPAFFKALGLNYVSPEDLPNLDLNDTGIAPDPSNGWIYTPGRVAINPRWDSFYTPDTSLYSGLTLGQVITYRQVGFAKSWTGYKRGWQISFRSTFGDGTTPSAEVTTVIEPNANDQQHGVILGFQEDAASLESSPSYTLAAGTTNNMWEQVLNKGWVVIIPDHEGINAVFGYLQHAYRILLDAGKAFNNFKSEVGLDNSEFILWGYSGGSVPVGGAIEHAQDYARELDIKAAFTGGLVANLETIAKNLDGGVLAGFLTEYIASFQNELPSFKSALAPLYKSAKLKARFESVTENGRGFYYSLLDFAGQAIFDSYFTVGPAGFWKIPEVQSAVAENKFGVGEAQVPVFVYNSINDEISPISLGDSVVDTWCKKGGSINYYRLGSPVEHALLLSTSESYVTEVMKDVFAGNYDFGKCNSWEDATRATDGFFSSKSLEDEITGA